MPCPCTSIRIPWRRVSRQSPQTAKVATIVEQVPLGVGALWVREERFRAIGRRRATVDIVTFRAEGAGGAAGVVRINSLSALLLRGEAGASPAKSEAGCHDEQIP